jgi:GNAT superfamily N-acetyltransferase
VNVSHKITRRPGSASDRAFLYALLRSSLGPHIEATYGTWDEIWQRRHFLQNSDPRKHEILDLDGEAVGCLLLQEEPECLQLHRIFLLPEYQNRGIGTQVIHELISEASSRSKPLRLRVFRISPAVRLYERLGFRHVGETQTHFLMEHAA